MMTNNLTPLSGVDTGFVGSTVGQGLRYSSVRRDVGSDNGLGETFSIGTQV